MARITLMSHPPDQRFPIAHQPRSAMGSSSVEAKSTEEGRMKTALLRTVVGLTVVGGMGLAAAVGYASGARSSALSPLVTEVESIAEHTGVNAAGYELFFYPGFSSRVSVMGAQGRETELYRQTEVYALPEGQPISSTRHAFQLRGGEHDRDFAFSIDDPKHQVARVIVELYGPDHVPGAGNQDQIVERVIYHQDAQTCPPRCDPAGASAK